MKRFQMLIKKGPLVFPMVLVVLGLLFGYLLARIFHSFLPEVIVNWNKDYMESMLDVSVTGMELFQYTLWHNIREMLIFFMLCLTILGIPYYAYCILKKSFQVSFLITIFLHIYGAKGIFLAFCQYFPQMIPYLFVAVLCLKHGFELYTDIQSGRIKPSFRNNILFKKYGKPILLITALLLCGAILEAALGRIIWIWAIEMMQK